MTRVYERSPGGDRGMRVLVVGAGSYPYAPDADARIPRLAPLDSVPPSALAFLERLLGPWRDSLAMDLVSVDLLLSDPNASEGAVWPGFGMVGEAAAGTPIAPPTLPELQTALGRILAGADPSDGLLIFFCGHGFSRGTRYFVLSDFGTALNPWERVVDLDGFKLALRQKPPRTQWLFWDCCADIPQEVVDALGSVGTTLIPLSASALAGATATFGRLSQFGAASAALGEQAFAMPGEPSRFTEMLIEALDRGGATKRRGGRWWVNDRGLMDALTTYARRHPNLKNADFYDFVTPFSSDSPSWLPFRELNHPPPSTLLARSSPDRAALKRASVSIVRDHAPAGEAPAYQQPPPPSKAQLCVQLTAHQNYTLTVHFEGSPPQSYPCFADLPLADEVEVPSP